MVEPAFSEGKGLTGEELVVEREVGREAVEGDEVDVDGRGLDADGRETA